MKVSECAELTGVTVRTIRYYHQVGLVPVPDEVDGARDYSMSHVARILRVRWLAGAGLSLDTIGSMLDDDLGSGLHDLEATADTLAGRIEELTVQRQRVLELIDTVRDGQEVSPVTHSVRSFYEQVAARVQTDQARDLVRREMRLAELFSQRGLIVRPHQLDALMQTLDEAAIDRASSFYDRLAILPDLDDAAASRLTDELEADIIHWADENRLLTDQTLALIPDWGFTPLGRRVISGFLHLLSPHRRQARLMDRITTALLQEKP